MMEGFGVHTFRFINARGVARFVKFHWNPKLGRTHWSGTKRRSSQGATPTSTGVTCGRPSQPATSLSGS
jgi:catalase